MNPALAEAERKRKRKEKSKRRAERKRSRKLGRYSLVPNGQANTSSTNGVSQSSGSTKSATAASSICCPKKLLDIFSLTSPGDLSGAGGKVLHYIASTKVDQFLKDVYEKKPLLVKRHEDQPNYFSGVFSKALVETLFEQKKLRYTRDFSLTQYQDGARTTLKTDTEEIAESKTVWKLFNKQKCSIRLLRPHEHSEILWKMMSSLEAFFHCGGGSNLYLTPKGAQGFAPHYDDIDAFILQLEGKKHWTVYETYKPSKKANSSKATVDSDEDDDDEEEDPEDLFPKFPRYSSKDFTQSDVKNNLKVAVKTTLEPGDFLYIPRGFVHQAKSAEDTHSLHITISTGQKNSWADFIAQALPHALERACYSDLTHDCAELRKTLPRDYAEYVGIINSDKEKDPRREAFMKNVVSLVTKHVLNHIDVDVIADRMSVKFQHDRHHPLGILPSEESADAELNLDSLITVRAMGVATLTVEGDAAIVYHSCKNTKTYHETEPAGIEFDLPDAEMIEQVLTSDPSEGKRVRDFMHCMGDKDKLRIAKFLLQEKIVKIIE